MEVYFGRPEYTICLIACIRSGVVFSVDLVISCVRNDRYGVKQFVLLSPDEGVECLTSQAQAKLMLSSISIAISNTQW